LHVRHVVDLLAALVLIAQQRRAPVDAFVVLQNKTLKLHQDQDMYS
jgi:hypothetical protein